MRNRLLISCTPSVLDRIAEHARRDAPRECCGLLIGGASRIDEALALENRAVDPLRRYEIDPRDYLAAVKRCRGTAHEVIGAYHSHVHSSAEPSATDLAEAVNGFLYLIAGPLAGNVPLQIRAYRLMGGNFQTLRLVPDAEDPDP
jgi:proteasome lid subunit RPN8/RPN11